MAAFPLPNWLALQQRPSQGPWCRTALATDASLQAAVDAVIEDVLEGAYKELPYAAFSQALFALVYAHKKVGIIPDSVLSLGYADNSSVVRAVLIQNEKAFAIYAGTQNCNWQKITSQP